MPLWSEWLIVDARGRFAAAAGLLSGHRAQTAALHATPHVRTDLFAAWRSLVPPLHPRMFQAQLSWFVGGISFLGAGSLVMTELTLSVDIPCRLTWARLSFSAHIDVMYSRLA